jgi:hypothetical protein
MDARSFLPTFPCNPWSGFEEKELQEFGSSGVQEYWLSGMNAVIPLNPSNTRTQAKEIVKALLQLLNS